MKTTGNEEEKKNSERQTVIFLLKFTIAAEGLFANTVGIQDANSRAFMPFSKHA